MILREVCPPQNCNFTRLASEVFTNFYRFRIVWFLKTILCDFRSFILVEVDNLNRNKKETDFSRVSFRDFHCVYVFRSACATYSSTKLTGP